MQSSPCFGTHFFVLILKYQTKANGAPGIPWASQVVLVIRNPPAADVRDPGSVSGLGRSPRGGNGNPLQYSCLENPMDKAAWWSMGSQRVGHNSSDLARRDSRLHLGLLCHPAFLSCLQPLILPHTQAFTNTILLAQHF